MGVIDDNWDYSSDKSKIENGYPEFEKNIRQMMNSIENGLKTQTFLYNLTGTENEDNELKSLVEQNKELSYQKAKKLELNSAQVAQFDMLKKDQKLLTQEIKKTHEAFLRAKKQYKKCLKMYYTVDFNEGKAQTVFVQFFTEAKKDSNIYSVSILRNSNTGHYQIVSTTPMLSSLHEVQRKLQESNDVPGALCYIRQAYKEMNRKKN